MSLFYSLREPGVFIKISRDIDFLVVSDREE